LKANAEDASAPKSVSVGAAGKEWDLGWVSYEGFKAFLPAETTVSVTEDGEGWYAIDVTKIVKDWLDGEHGNNGFALTGVTDGEEYAFYSSYAVDAENAPKLEVNFTKGVRAVYGKFTYSEQTDGNCLSYALRDTDGIYFDALGIDYSQWVSLYNESGINAILPTMTQTVLNYVNSNAAALKISSIRVIDGFNGEIDTANEYRVAMRIGARDSGGIFGVIDEEDFDYHFQSQLSNGSWAEKMPQDISRIVPGSHAGLSPENIQWDTSPMWGNDKWNNFYTSSAVFFAVTKDSDGFTAHLSEK
jgi:hypothetical protein